MNQLGSNADSIELERIAVTKRDSSGPILYLCDFHEYPGNEPTFAFRFVDPVAKAQR